MKYLKMLFVLLMVITMFGCSTFHYPTSKSNESFTAPEIGIEATAYLGDPIITTGSGYYADGLYVNNTNNTSTVTISQGFYELVHNDNMYKYYYPASREMLIFYNGYGVKQNYDLELRIGNDNSFGVSTNKYGYANAKSIKNNLQIEQKNNYFIAKKNSLQQTVIYTGKQDNILKFSYREFSNDMARPAFTTDITYDMNESNIIGYKSFRAEVIEATNTEIKYKIIQGFNK